VGSMTLLLAVRGNIATRSMSGPPFSLQLYRPTVWCGATEGMLDTQISALGGWPTVSARFSSAIVVAENTRLFLPYTVGMNWKDAFFLTQGTRRQAWTCPSRADFLVLKNEG
jgi:hypothetical protein